MNERVAERLRLIFYTLSLVGVAAAILSSPTVLETRISALVGALATIALAAVAIEALVFNKALVKASRDSANAAGEQAKAALEAVDAAQASTEELRRQALLASVPFLRMLRPVPVDNETGLLIRMRVENVGPGTALEAVIHIEAKYRASSAFAPGTVRSGSAKSVLTPGDSEDLEISAQELRNMDAPRWQQQVSDGAGGQIEVAQPPDLFVPEVIRVRLRWLSTLGAGIEQTYLWETGDFSKVDPVTADAWTWRFEQLTINPGEGLKPLTFARPQ